VENALYWLAEYRVDGLRLDAVHAIYDFSADHVLAELGREFHALAARLGKRALLIAESDLNDTRVTRPAAEGGWQLDAQWSDDFHHALTALVTGARHGYFADFGSVSDLAKAFESGFVYDGRHSTFRGRRHGNSSAARPGRELCVFAQNHDQIANAWHGRRLAELVPVATQRLVACVLAFAPNRILLFQGQEWGETNPFFYFTDHGDPELSRAVREGRARELAEFGAAEHFRDPQDEATFLESKLDWSRRSAPGHRELSTFHQTLLKLRRSTPALADFDKTETRAWSDDASRWLVVARGPPGRRALLVASFADTEARVSLPISAPWRIAVWTAESAPPAAPASGTLRLPAGSAAILLESAPND
jgi:maltooligosyltrehalose trehalohydrolase